MTLPVGDVLAALRAIGEDTRLRLVALLRHGELTVTDLTEICGQSQPRISRHLRLLAEAGVVDRHREGAWVYFALTPHGPVRELVDGVLAGADPDDPLLAGDLERLAGVRTRRALAAQEYFARIAAGWDHVRSLHAPEADVERAVLDAVGDRRYAHVLDVGTGTGRMLELLAGSADRLTGLDANHSMLAVARANLERAELPAGRVDLRQGDAYSMPFDRGSFDLVVIHQVLHYLDDPARAVAEAARLVAPGGRLLVVDFAPHTLESLQAEHNHRRLGFRAETLTDWYAQAGLRPVATRAVDGGELTVQLWLGEAPSAGADHDADRERPAPAADHSGRLEPVG